MSILEGHLCEPSDNPRHSHACRKCGKPILDSTTRRDVDLEREFTREAARGAVDVTPLIEFAETRALSLSGSYVSDPMMVASHRDRLRDVREELADARNHIVWWLQSHVGHEQAPDALIALRFIALAYDRLLEET